MKFTHGLPIKRKKLFDLLPGTSRIKILEEDSSSYLTFLVQEITNTKGMSNYFIRKPTLPGRTRWNQEEKVNFMDTRFVSEIFRLIKEEVNGIEHLFLINEEGEKELFGYIYYNSETAYLMHFLTDKEVRNNQVKASNKSVIKSMLLFTSIVITLFLTLNIERVINMFSGNDGAGENSLSPKKTKTLDVIQASDMSGDYKIIIKK